MEMRTPKPSESDRDGEGGGYLYLLLPSAPRARPRTPLDALSPVCTPEHETAPSEITPSGLFDTYWPATEIFGLLSVGRWVRVSPVPVRQPSIRSGRSWIWRRPLRRVRSRCSSSVKAVLAARHAASAPPTAHSPADPSRSRQFSHHERTARRPRTGSARETAAAPRSAHHPAHIAHQRPTAGITPRHHPRQQSEELSNHPTSPFVVHGAARDITMYAPP